MPLTTSTTDRIDKRMADDPEFAAAVDAELQAMHVEQELVALRQARGLSQYQLARLLDVSQPVIAKLEAGKSPNIGLRTLVRLAHALGGRVQLAIVPTAHRRRMTGRKQTAVVRPSVASTRRAKRSGRKRTER